MPITIGNGNINLNTDIKAINDIKGKLAKTGIQFDGSNVRISAREMFLKKVTQRGIKGQLASLYSSKGASSLTFPADLDDEHYIIINVVKRNNQTIRDAKGKDEILQSVVLPIPGNLAVAYAAQYENTSLGILGAMSAGRVGGTSLSSGVQDAVAAIANKVSQFNSDSQSVGEGLALGGTIAATTGIASRTLLGAALIGAGGVSSVVTGQLLQAGLAINPHQAQVFRGVDFRSHQLDYKFVARNQTESNTLKSIITAFKQAMLPGNAIGSREGSAGLAFSYPEEFTLSFAPRIASYLYKFGRCVLTNFNITYNGENLPIFFETTGAPVSINLSMTFQETQVLTKDGFSTYENSPNNLGANIDAVDQSTNDMNAVLGG